MKRLLALMLLSAGIAPAANGVQQFADLGDFKLQSGQIIRNLKIGYRSLGTLNDAKSNAILWPTWFTGNSADLVRTIDHDHLVDTSRFFVILVDAIGNGVSSAPSNSPEQPRLRFPQFTIRDMIESQRKLLTGVLGISHLRAVMGISMGGMQTFEWVVAYPTFMDLAIPIVGSPRLTAYDLELWQTEKHIIEEDRDWNNGNYASMPSLKALADLHDLNLTTPKYRAGNTKPDEFDQYLATVEKNGPDRFDANNWLRQLEAMIGHDVSRALGGSMEQAARAVKARMLVVVATQDHMVNPIPATAFAKAAGARLLELTGDCGHIAPGCEATKLSHETRAFLER